MISPLLYITYQIDPLIIPLALTSFAGIFSITSLYALNKKSTDLIKYSNPLTVCLGGIIVCNVAGILMNITGVGSELVSMTSLATSVVSSIVFTSLFAVDTHRAIQSYEEGNLDSTEISIDLFLDSLNLFIDLIKIISHLTKNINDN
jgi:FtsH-binding integral membrane protein